MNKPLGRLIHTVKISSTKCIQSHLESYDHMETVNISHSILSAVEEISNMVAEFVLVNH